MASARILVVEDSPVMRQLMGRVLQRLPDVEWDEAGDGAEALKKLATGTYALALVDLHLPVLDGLKLIERMRKGPDATTTKIIVVTTDSAKQDVERAMELGADDYLLKPIQLTALRSVIEGALRGSEG